MFQEKQMNQQKIQLIDAKFTSYQPVTAENGFLP